MKMRALVGFTWPDAFSWLATEARAKGCAIMVSSSQKRAWLRDDQYFIVKDESEIEKLGVRVDEIITREGWEFAA
jgi:hypothetical protein